MALDPNPALRVELNAALDVLFPEIKGLIGLSAMGISQDSRDAINKEIVNRERRRDLIQAVLNALDATLAALTILDNDGYPSLPNVNEASPILAEIAEQNRDVAIAAGIFGISNAPTSISLDLAHATLVPQPRPARVT